MSVGGTDRISHWEFGLNADSVALSDQADLSDKTDQSNRPDQAGDSDFPSCPQCGKPMVLRTAKTGPNAGKQFLGCSSYPDCKGAKNL